MTESILVTLITGILTFAGVCITSLSANRKTQAKLETAQAVTEAKLNELTLEVRAHNAIVRHIPVMEVRLHAAEQQLQNAELRRSAN